MDTKVKEKASAAYYCPLELWMVLTAILIAVYFAYFIVVGVVTAGKENPVMFLRPECPHGTVFPLGDHNVFTGVLETLWGGDDEDDEQREAFFFTVLMRKLFRGHQWSSNSIKTLARGGSEHFEATDPILCLELCKASHTNFGSDDRQITTSCDYSYEGFKGEIINHTATLFVSLRSPDCVVLGAAFDPHHRGNIHCHGRPFFPVTAPQNCEDPRNFDRDDSTDGRIPVGNSTSCWFSWERSKGYAWLLKEGKGDGKEDDGKWPEVHGISNSVQQVVIPPGDYWWMRGHRRLHQDTAAFVVTYKKGTHHDVYAVPLSNSMNGDAIPF